MNPTLPYRLRKLNRVIRARVALLGPAAAAAAVLPGHELVSRLEYQSGNPTNRLIVFLPGITDLAEDFERHGFVHELQRRHIGVDAVAIDTHYGYYAARSLFRRITEDVVAAAHIAGYAKVWLVGISLGGFGAACYATRHAQLVEGIVLLAPYLGERALIDDIEKVGGIRQWNPGHVSELDFARHVWACFKWRASGGVQAPRIYLGYGNADKFASAHRLLADVLPEEDVFVVPGGHDWRTWTRLWTLFLARWHGVEKV